MNRLLSALILLALPLTLAGCGGGDSGTAPTDAGTLVIEDLVVGTGATAAVGDVVTVNYVGTLTNATNASGTSHERRLLGTGDYRR